MLLPKPALFSRANEDDIVSFIDAYQSLRAASGSRPDLAIFCYSRNSLRSLVRLRPPLIYTLGAA